MWTRLGLFAFVLGACASGDSASSITANPDLEVPDMQDDWFSCHGDNGGLELPPGFCATVFADRLGAARHMAVTPSGDVFVAIAPPRPAIAGGKVIALRDADGDGQAEVQRQIADFGGNGIAWADGYLYVAPHDRVVRFALPDGAIAPRGAAETIVRDLPATPDHDAKTILPVGDDLYVNIGSASNACQVENRVPHSPGKDPCPELAERAGIWRFSASTKDQCMTTGHGERVATGVRNGNALAYDKRADRVWSAVNGRDQLHENWPELFTMEQDLQLPAEEIVAIDDGADYGWPYCYYDPFQGKKVLAPEYGGDGTKVGRCAAMDDPAATLPAHWAPLGMAFYEGNQFPREYRHGAFIANHGSRFDENALFDPGYNVVFVPWESGRPSGEWTHFATGFPGGGLPLPDAAIYRPVGVAVMPDGSLLISDDKVGRIWKVSYVRANNDDDVPYDFGFPRK